MRKISIAAVVLVILAGACKKSDTRCDYDQCSPKAPTGQIAELTDYLTRKGIINNVVMHCSGMYYQIIAPGTESTPGVCSFIDVNYKGTDTSGTVFGQTTSASGPLRDLFLDEAIEGWKKGIPLIKKGGIIKLYIPPALAYPQERPGIPFNSILIFEVELVDIK